MEGRGNPLPSKKGPVRSGWWCSTLFFSRDILRVKMKERSVLFMIGKPEGRPDICTVSGPGVLSAPSPYQPSTGVTGRISAPFPDRECYPLLHSVRPVPEVAVWISAPFPDRECYPLLHPVRPVPEWAVRISAPFPGRIGIRSFTLSAPYLSGQDGCLQGFRTGSVSAPSPCQPRT